MLTLAILITGIRYVRDEDIQYILPSLTEINRSQVAYTILLLPIAACRFAEWSGHEVPFAVTIARYVTDPRCSEARPDTCAQRCCLPPFR